METFDLDTALIQLSGDRSGKQPWTIRNAVEGVQIFGGIGSGKTSGSGRMIALKFLKAGFGGLVLTVKPSEKEDWLEYCRLTGREDDLIIVEPGGEHFFDFLDYESKDGFTDNIVQVLKTVIQAGEGQTGGDDPFWENALDMLIFNIVDLCKLAYGKVSVQQMFDIVQTLPKQGQVKRDGAFNKTFVLAQSKVNALVETWETGLSTEDLQRIQSAHDHQAAAEKDIPEVRTLKFLDEFFSDTFLNLAEKTRSIIEFSFSGFLFRLLRDPVYTLFCNRESTFLPEDCLKGKIIILNLPVKTFHKIGRDSQILFKYIWQRAMERRNIQENDRPVFLFADEAQNFIHEHDTQFQATARSSRIATVYISQNLPNYLASMGGAKSENRVRSFLGTLNTKIFHANADIITNQYASELIGDLYYEETSRTATASGQFSSSRTRSMKIDRAVRPEAFAQLKTGGTPNNGLVEAYIHLQGSPVKDGQNFSRIVFDQNYMSHH